MKKDVDKRIIYIFLRYIFLIAIVLPGLWFFYYIFTPLTVYPSYFLFSLLYDTSLSGTDIVVNNSYTLEIVNACVAGSAYFLLLILNLSVPVKSLKKRIYSIVASFSMLLFLNLMRIFFLGVLFVNESVYFDATHKFLWYFLSTIFVVAIWFSETVIFKIREIPFFTDLNLIYRKSTLSK